MDDARAPDTRTARITAEEALALHAEGKPGKLEIRLTKPLTTARDLSLAYSPGVAEPCLHIHRDPSLAYDYTAKGNMVAVISNGTAVLGLGNLGALAGKPVMEGKAALFKRFADVDSIDLCVSTEDVDEFVNSVRYLGPSFGGINLEDIKAPECFVIEQRLRELMDIPVFHDDQHGTAIVAAAGLINACHLTGRELKDTRLVINGAGSAAIACAELVKAMGMRPENILMCDTKGVLYRGRTEGMNQWKSAHAVSTDRRTLSQALEGADAFFGLSVKGAVTPAMVASMAKNPIIFAMANPDPEITPDEARAVRPDVIVATGRSDYPNQVNNVLGFPFIFRGALDVRASTINEAMKIAAAEALAMLAREDVPEEVAGAGGGAGLRFGPDYIIPHAFDPRLISHVSPAVAKAAMDSGVARKPILDMQRYARGLAGRLDAGMAALEAVTERVRANPQKVVFAEGEEEKVIRAAIAFRNAGYGTPVLVGREERVRETVAALGIPLPEGIEIHNARLSDSNLRYAEWLYARQQRQGLLFRDCQRLVNQDRNVFAACMVALGDADAMVSGVTRSFSVTLEGVTRAVDAIPGRALFGLTVLLSRTAGTTLIADTAIHERPDAETLAQIAKGAAAAASRMGLEPRVAFLSFSNFGDPGGTIVSPVREAVKLLDERGVDFEYDGEMGADVALDPQLRALYPFCRLSGPANVLVMPGLHAAHILSKAVPRLTSATTLGPILVGLEHPVQIASMGASVNQILDMACFAAHGAVMKD
ncbi:NADP-dependent malic enzyme [Pseudoroseomonas ludipueritiae]|uniref:NADP-dependent malic enzyme n=1 Tax=Pseudoroseomonas ludipueritiae TaxID=198093 RepID=A0ABR7R601_9PROT|nr:NADP-dependent malic enzyme [Pseudoroseomonas ludipueritiae]MBC9177087.1 NADP-dependent malic enzyme [Pseudoroseomonas ludipueritiae]MCG7362133.1 NADP-dependent malic enzyme [Roseomonas sp. ACRSG]